MQKRDTFHNTKRGDNDVEGLSSRDAVSACQAVVPGALQGDIPARHVPVLELIKCGLCCVKIPGPAKALQDLPEDKIANKNGNLAWAGVQDGDLRTFTPLKKSIQTERSSRIIYRCALRPASRPI
jgi:hypothetical protein